jgi:DNA-binding NarL/FixJ family response regulator
MIIALTYLQCMIHVAIIDDNYNLLQEVESHFETYQDITLVGTASSIEEFVSAYKNTLINVLLLDIQLPGNSGLEALPLLKKMLPDTDIVMFTVVEDDLSLIKAFCNGAVGYLIKDTPASLLYDYVQLIQKGGSAISAKLAQRLFHLLCVQNKPLSILNEKEYEVLKLLADGWSYKLIADQTGLSEDGVRFYVKRIYRALNVHSKGEAIRVFFRGS